MNAEDVCRALCATLSPDPAQRLGAETYLNNCRRTEGFPVLLLQLVDSLSQHHSHERSSGAVGAATLQR